MTNNLIDSVKGQLICTIVIPDYVKEVKLSDSQRAAYYYLTSNGTIKWKSKIPLDYVKADKLKACKKNKAVYESDLIENYKIVTFDKNINILCNVTKEGKITKVIANPDSVGKPCIKKINGQSVYNSTIKEFERGFVMKTIKDNFKDYIEKIEPITLYPILIDVELHDNVKNSDRNSRWDVDNRMFLYNKAFCDSLKEYKKIIDDDRLHITRPPQATFFPINENEKRKLVFHIYKDNRDFSKYFNENKEKVINKNTNKLKEKIPIKLPIYLKNL